MNKTIYMTYKNPVPDKVLKRWTDINNEYNIEFSLDSDCYQFLKTHFNYQLADLFMIIPEGMYKADLWRLCKLYINGGVYADVDLIPYINIDSLDKNISFYSCLSIDSNHIFQAFMIVNSKPKNALMLHFLISFLVNKPYKFKNGPTIDMYNCISNNIGTFDIIAEKIYNFDHVKILISIGRSGSKKKLIDLIYFPNDIQYSITLNPSIYNDTFDLKIVGNYLIVERTDKNSGWDYDHSCTIMIQSNESVYLFTEKASEFGWQHSYVTYKGNKIFDSHDLDYIRNNRSW